MGNIADTANFIVITPQAIGSFLGTAWNSGASMSGMQLNETVNDLGFINALIDSVSAHYNIDQRRIYATGFSMGAFMCYRLACQLGNRIAAIAPVSGTMGTSLICQPSRPIPICHFHGTADQTISYTANQYGTNVDSTLKYWVNYNQCNTLPQIESMPDIATDGFTVEHYTYSNGNYGSTIEHYKVIGGGHQWIYTPVNDIDYTSLIWKFLSRYSNLQLKADQNVIPSIHIFPNPTSSFINIENPENTKLIIKLYSINGRVINEISASDFNIQLDIRKLATGLYFIELIETKSNYRNISKIQVIN
jgi:polyhydroxybutyrate depolymerase